MLPAALERIRRKLHGSDDGDRQMVAVLAAVLIDGLPAVGTACAEALAEGVHSASVILNILARKKVRRRLKLLTRTRSNSRIDRTAGCSIAEPYTIRKFFFSALIGPSKKCHESAATAIVATLHISAVT